MVIECESCGVDFRHSRPGPTPRFCTSRCRQRAHRAGVPAEMRRLPRWTARDGKRPMMMDGRPASSTNAGTWTTYAAVKRLPHGVMLGDGLACLDLDDCFDGGKLRLWARAAISKVADPIYIERSMSGEGLHVFHRAPESRGRKHVTADGGGIEWYSHSRFIAVTGDRVRLP